MKRVLIGFCLFAVYLTAVYGLMPFHDDWSYATAPNPDFVWSQLLPSAAFWRPFDVLWGAMLSHCPNLFPVANRACVALAHAISSVVLFDVFRRIGCAKKDAILGACFFATSSALAATVVNSDTINQAWSFCWGAIALLVSLGAGCGTWKHRILIGGLVLLSILFKESGVSWLAVIPLVVCYRDRNGKLFMQQVGAGILLLVVYFVLRFALMGDVQLGDGEYYALGFNPESVILSYLISVVLAISGIDALSFAIGAWPFFIVSLFSSVTFWGCWIASARQKECGLKFGLALLLALALATPHCFFKGHHPAEMHFYPVLFAGSLFVALLEMDKGMILVRIGGCVAFCFLTSSGWWDKLTESYRYSARTRNLFLRLQNTEIDFNKPVYFIAEGDPTVASYSVFSQSAGHGINWGKACRALNGWREFDYRIAYRPEHLAAIPWGAQTIRIK